MFSEYDRIELKMSDKKHKHTSKEKKKDRDRDQKRRRSRSRSRSLNSRDKSTDKYRKQSTSKDGNRVTDHDRHRRRRSVSRSVSRERNRYKEKHRNHLKSQSPEYDRSTHQSSSKHYARHKSDRFAEYESCEPSSERQSNQDEVTNLVNFSFFDYKTELTKVLSGYTTNDSLVSDIDDFWLFLKKYEATLRNSGQTILPEPLDDTKVDIDEETGLPKTYHRAHCVLLKFTVPFENLYGRLSTYDQTTKLSKRKVKQFLQIVLEYLDFCQKETLKKIKKLRQTQAELPVAKYKNEIIEAVAKEQVVLVAGDTGCGKSTQIPQYLRQAGYESICCTQPRRIACISLSKRVAHEMLCEYTNEVGYQIRFERNKNKNTKIIFMTEGLLLRQLATEAALTQFDVIVLDEVHERHLHGDFLLGVS